MPHSGSARRSRALQSGDVHQLGAALDGLPGFDEDLIDDAFRRRLNLVLSN